jgi:D-alanine transfer protein
MADQANNDPVVEAPHLWAAGKAVGQLTIFLLWFGQHARSLENQAIHALAAERDLIVKTSSLYQLKNQGKALQLAALQQGDLLVCYASSELNDPAPYEVPYHAANHFHDYPTGFTIFPINKEEMTCLPMLQRLASVGSELRGKKIVISVSPAWFFERPMARQDGYAGNFSALHAGELLFDTRLSLAVKQEAARRMLQYPATVENAPLLNLALHKLSDGSLWSLGQYYALLPLGRIQNLILSYQDHWAVVAYLREHFANGPIPEADRRPSSFDWTSLVERAERAYKPHSNSNPLHFGNNLWLESLRSKWVQAKMARTDKDFLRMLQESKEWVDLDILLRGLKELGADPVVVAPPIHGPWYDHSGITYHARLAFYEKLRAATERHQVPVYDFAEHDNDRTFCHDFTGHLSPKGWVYYCQLFDAFYHDAFPPSSRLPTSQLLENVPPAQGGPEPVYEGIHDPTNADTIRGWAWDRARPNHAVSVDVYDGSKLLASVSADRLREDLARSGKGNGRHAFTYLLPETLRDGKPHTIRVRIAGTDIDLRSTPRQSVLAATASPRERPQPPASSGPGRAYEGFHDETNERHIKGWVWDRNHPEEALKVDIFDGDKLLTTVVADQLRQDLLQRKAGNGRHGFLYTVPAALRDGKPHSIRVRVAGTNFNLKKTPQSLRATPRSLTKPAPQPTQKR